MTGLEAIRETYADPWVRLALKIRMATLADIKAPQKLLDFLEELKARQPCWPQLQTRLMSRKR